MSKMRYFKKEEFDCKHTSKNAMSPLFLSLIDELRGKCGFPFIITSGYRDPSHPIEAKKTKPGVHAQGIAADIKVSSDAEAYIVMKNAFKLRFTGIARGEGFVHVDIRDTSPVSWLY